MGDHGLEQLKIDKGPGTRPRRRRRGPLIAVVVVVAVLLVALWRGWLTPRVEVQVGTVSQLYPSQTFTLLNASGYVVAQRKAAVAAKTTGRLEWLGVEEGSRVTSGQVLARLENRDAAASRDQAAASVGNARALLDGARIELVDAERLLKRQQELVQQGVIAQAEYDVTEARRDRARAAIVAAEAAVRTAEAALTGAEAAFDYALIRAPFDGVVLTKNADVGDIITPIGAAASAKAAVVTIADMGSLQVEADVAESNLAKIRVGQPCEVTLDAIPDSRFQGVLHIIVPTADRSKASVMVKVRFIALDPRILPEMSAKVAFLERPVAAAEQQPRTVVKPQAVVRRDGRSLVYVLRGDRVAETAITLGPSLGDGLEVTGGVKAGEKIVLSPLDKMREGLRVKVAEQ